MEVVLYDYYVIVKKVEDVFCEVCDVVDVLVVCGMNMELVV